MQTNSLQVVHFAASANEDETAPCTDLALPAGEPFHVLNAPGRTCAWFADRDMCAKYGDSQPASGTNTANEACCVCKGGVRGATPPSLPPCSTYDEPYACAMQGVRCVFDEVRLVCVAAPQTSTGRPPAQPPLPPRTTPPPPPLPLEHFTPRCAHVTVSLGAGAPLSLSYEIGDVGNGSVPAVRFTLGWDAGVAAAAGGGGGGGGYAAIGLRAEAGGSGMKGLDVYAVDLAGGVSSSGVVDCHATGYGHPTRDGRQDATLAAREGVTAVFHRRLAAAAAGGEGEDVSIQLGIKLGLAWALGPGSAVGGLWGHHGGRRGLRDVVFERCATGAAEASGAPTEGPAAVAPTPTTLPPAPPSVPPAVGEHAGTPLPPPPAGAATPTPPSPPCEDLLGSGACANATGCAYDAEALLCRGEGRGRGGANSGGGGGAGGAVAGACLGAAVLAGFALYWAFVVRRGSGRGVGGHDKTGRDLGASVSESPRVSEMLLASDFLRAQESPDVPLE